MVIYTLNIYNGSLYITILFPIINILITFYDINKIMWLI